MNTIEKLDAVIAELTEARKDAEKFIRGKKGDPGTRLRKAALKGARDLGELRKHVSEVRKGEALDEVPA